MRDPLGEHLDASRRLGRDLAVILVVLLGAGVLAAWLSGFQVAVVVAVVALLGIAALMGYLTWRANVRETDRLLDEAIEEGRDE